MSHRSPLILRVLICVGIVLCSTSLLAFQSDPADASTSSAGDATAVSTPADNTTGRGFSNTESKANSPLLTDWIQVGISAFLFFVIAYQAYIYDRQRGVMERQFMAMREGLDETRKIVKQNELVIGSAEKQSRAAEVAAKAACDSAATARESLNVVERAYLGIANIEVKNLKLRGQVAVPITFVNAGRTPAWNLASCAELILSEGAKPKWEWEANKAILSPPGSLLAFNQEKTITHRSPNLKLGDEEQRALETKQAKLFAIGEARYTDIRGNRQVLPFCAVYNWHSSIFESCFAEEG